MKIYQGFASLWYGHANMAFKASSALPECRQTTQGIVAPLLNRFWLRFFMAAQAGSWKKLICRHLSCIVMFALLQSFESIRQRFVET